MGSIKQKHNAGKAGQDMQSREGAWKNIGQQFQKDALSFVKFNGQHKSMPILGKQHKGTGAPVPVAAPVKPTKTVPQPPKTATKPAKAAPVKPMPAPKAATPAAAKPQPLPQAVAPSISNVDINAAANLQDSDAVLAQILEQKRILDEQIASLLAMKQKPSSP